MASFKVACPSCENPVPIKNESLIGTKVECSKCKYRFKVEEPAGGAAADGEKPDKKKAAPADAGAKKKKSKKLVAVVVGVLAVGILGVVGMSVIGGGDDKKKTSSVPPPAVRPVPPPVADPNANPDAKTDPNDPTKTVPKVVVPPPIPKVVLARSDKEPSNLLPGQSVAVFRFDLNKLHHPPISSLFDKTTLEMFQTSFGFDIDRVGLYYHTYVGDAREPFGVIHLKDTIAESDVVGKMASASAPKKVKKWTLYSLKSNPFVNGVASSLSFNSLFADAFEKAPANSGNDTDKSRLMGLCVYDTQHIFVGDHALIEKFLDDLNDKGYPKFQSAVGAPMPGVAIAENPLYLSIDPKLKRLLKDLGAEVQSPPPVVIAENYAGGNLDAKLFKSDLQPFATSIEPIVSRLDSLGLAVNSLNPKQFIASMRLVMKSDTAAIEVVRDQLVPNLPNTALMLTWALQTPAPVEFRNLTASSGLSTAPVGPDGLPPGAGGRPERTGVRPERTGVRPEGGEPLPPGMPPGTTPPGTETAEVIPPSRIELGMTDQNISLTLDLSWSSDIYRKLIEPQLIGMGNTLKGKMAVYVSEQSYHALSRAVRDMIAVKKAFPPGTTERKLTDPSRMGLKYPPETRVSFFADLLPFMDRNTLAFGIDKNLAWFEGQNLLAAESWVPELLVPLYPPSAWRATSPYVSAGRVLGGTNYVAIAGAGLDAGRYDPKNPAQAKKVGICGYDWGSKVEEVTDGPANTIFLMQTPPGLQQPWIAGGGAETIRGLDEKDPMKGFRHTYGTPDGKEGTFALMGDGSVRFIPGDIDPKILLAMATRAGGEDISAVIDKAAPLVTPSKKEVELKADPKVEEPKPADAKPATTAPAPREKK